MWIAVIFQVLQREIFQEYLFLFIEKFACQSTVSMTDDSTFWQPSSGSKVLLTNEASVSVPDKLEKKDKALDNLIWEDFVLDATNKIIGLNGKALEEFITK